jgi:hypothetical protein
MPDACASPPVTRSHRNRSPQPRFLVRPKRLIRLLSLPAGRGLLLSDLSTADLLQPDGSVVIFSRRLMNREDSPNTRTCVVRLCQRQSTCVTEHEGRKMPLPVHRWISL